MDDFLDAECVMNALFDKGVFIKKNMETKQRNRRQIRGDF